LFSQILKEFNNYCTRLDPGEAEGDLLEAIKEGGQESVKKHYKRLTEATSLLGKSEISQLEGWWISEVSRPPGNDIDIVPGIALNWRPMPHDCSATSRSWQTLETWASAGRRPDAYSIRSV
jgi:hypothetical protein